MDWTMDIAGQIRSLAAKAIKELYQVDTDPGAVTITITKPEFEGDYTMVLFSLVKQLKKSPEQLGNELGQRLIDNDPALLTGYTVIKGFLNLTVSNDYWVHFLQSHYNLVSFGRKSRTGQKVMVEYSSPNTNKPLHLGHLRNNILP